MHIDDWYKEVDPWGYQTNPDDIKRKCMILAHLSFYERALDIGAGEGWITKDLPAKEIHAIEMSDVAASRFPKHVKRVFEPEGKYDLIVATGVFYKQYDWKKMHEWIKESAIGKVVTCNIGEWEIPLEGWEYSEEFPYREYTQILRIYDFTS